MADEIMSKNRATISGLTGEHLQIGLRFFSFFFRSLFPNALFRPYSATIDFKGGNRKLA
jgi:hypothetical protein